MMYWSVEKVRFKDGELPYPLQKPQEPLCSDMQKRVCLPENNSRRLPAEQTQARRLDTVFEASNRWLSEDQDRL